MPGTITDDQARAIARALDPKFDGVCFVTMRELSDDGIAGLGIGRIAVPDGYELQHSYGQGVKGTGNCAGQSGFGIQWGLAGDGVGYIQAAAWGGLSGVGGFEAGYMPNIEGQTLYWKDARGYEFLVVGMNDLKGDRSSLLTIAELPLSPAARRGPG